MVATKKPKKKVGKSRPQDLIPGYRPEDQAGDCVFDEAAAQLAVDFFHQCLTFTAGQWRGRPFLLQPWQEAVIRTIFGWKRLDGTRRYREVFLYLPRKQGKTEVVGGLGNLLLFADREPGAQVFCAAADREQARLVFNVAKTMIAADPFLAERGRLYTHHVMYEQTGSVLRVISAEAYTKHGVNAHGIIIDELHAQPNRELVDVLMTSTGARRQPLTIYLTTADFVRESICNEKYAYACAVRDNGGDGSKPGYDPAFLPVIFEAIDGVDDWKSPETWAKANPNLGVSISYEYLERECKRAQETPTYENTFKRLHLNMQTQQDVRWLPMDAWKKSAGSVIVEDLLEGRECYGGLDLSTTTDMSAFVMVFPDGVGGYDVLPRFWMPEEKAVLRERRDKVPYSTWTSAGHVSMTPGATVDYDYIRAQIAADAAKFNLKEIAVDRWNASQLVVQLEQDGRTVLMFGQGFKDMSAPSKELEKTVIAGKLHHGNNPVLNWMAGNVAAEIDAAGNIKPSKKKSTDRIDGIVALIMALARASVNRGSVYETRGLIVL